VRGLPRRARGTREREDACGLARGPAGADRSLGGDRVTNRHGGFLERSSHAEPSLRAGDTAGGNNTTVADFDATRIEGEIGQLQQALDRGRGKLDPKTVKVLEENLRIIRKATEDARHALQQDPANRDLQDYLAGSVQRKLDLVRRAAVMAGV